MDMALVVLLKKKTDNAMLRYTVEYFRKTLVVVMRAATARIPPPILNTLTESRNMTTDLSTIKQL